MLEEEKFGKVENPISVQENQIISLYRLADRLEDVNWDARYQSNPIFLERLIPRLYDFTCESIKRITFDQENLRAVVGLSGGLDSSTSVYIIAESMRRSKRLGIAKETSLVLLSFKGMSEEDLENARKTAQQLSSSYSDISINYQERDLTGLLKEIDRYTDNIVAATGKTKQYPGELATRLISNLVLEYADKTNHCAVEATNGTEIVLGEISLGAGGEYAPIADLYKSQVYDIAERIGVPEFVINRPPIDSAFGTNKVLGYFGEMPDGFTPRDAYNVLDPVLYLVHERRWTPKTVSKKLGHSLTFTENVYRKVRNQDHRRLRPYFNVPDHRVDWSNFKNV